MGALLGKKRSRVTDHDKAIFKLQHQRDRLRQYQRQLDSSTEVDRSRMLYLLRNGEKQRALTIMKKRKLLEGLSDKMERNLTAVEQMIVDLEFGQIEVEVVEGLRLGSECLKKINSLMNVDDISRLMSVVNEQIEEQRAIGDAMGRGILVDEDKAEQELECLLSEQFPEVPVHNVMRTQIEESRVPERERIIVPS
ncbi:hypothetical protein ACOME3_005007 [Neoechinorhynchus agilis]